MSKNDAQEGAAKSRLGSVHSTVAKCLVCATVGGVGVLLPATAAVASTSGSTTAAAVNASPSVVTVPCATVQNEEGLVGSWGIGAKAMDTRGSGHLPVLPNAVACASDYSGPTVPGVSAAISALNNAEASGNWELEGAYPTPGSVQTVMNDLTTAVSNLNSAATRERSAPSSAYLVEAEQWVAYTAYDIDAQYRYEIGTDGVAARVNAWLTGFIAAGESDYTSGDYVGATSTFLTLLPTEYSLAAPPSSSNYCVIIFCGIP